MDRRLALTVASALLAGLLAAPAGATTPARTTTAAEADASANVKRIASFAYENEDKDFSAGGTDIDFSGKYVYAMQQGNDGGVHVFDASGPKPRKISFIPCPGKQNDVAVVKPGLIALGYHSSICGGLPGAGIRLVDVKNPRSPKLLGAVEIPRSQGSSPGSHTLTVYPGTSLIYSSPNGFPNVRGVESIVDVSNPNKPEITATYSPAGNSCHDITFHITKQQKLAFCPGTSGTEIWDVADPLAPSFITKTLSPGTQYHHSAVATHDGKYLVVGDEAVAGNDCVGGPTGSLWVYDIASVELPVLVGHWGPQRGPYPAGSPDIPNNAQTGPGDDTWCSAHLFNFVPGTYTLVGSWYAGGMSVVDFSDPSSPKELAHYMGTGQDITNYWSAYWYDGRIWANDRVKGLDVFTVKGLKEGKSKN